MTLITQNECILFLYQNTYRAPALQFDSDYDNKKYRVKQTTQLVEEILKESTADVIFLGGDFNAGPHSKPYQIVQAYMKNSIEDVYWKLRAWLQPKWATYANEKVCGALGLVDF